MEYPRLQAQTVRVDDPGDLLSFLPPAGAVGALRADSLTTWVHSGEGLVGIGRVASLAVSGPERFSRAQRWWARLCSEAVIVDDVAEPGTGPVAFASFAFDSAPGDSVLIVPELIIGRREGKGWLTRIWTDSRAPGPPTLPNWGPGSSDRSAATITARTGAVSRDRWQTMVTEAMGHIERDELDKVVLARDEVLEVDRPLDLPELLRSLASGYAECWTFSVDGLVGATPEILVSRRGDQVSSRVLAGTVRRDSDSGRDGRLAAELLDSDKDQQEHAYAVASVAAALAAHCTDLTVPDAPSVLTLPNVQHLATEVTGLLADSSPVLGLAASLHPTAAVCGTPTERASRLIRELEGLDRGRYAGPVGWLDAHGDGEFGIALRCGQIENDRQIRLFAGCGIVPGSDPASEWAESEAKLVAMREAVQAN